MKKLKIIILFLMLFVLIDSVVAVELFPVKQRGKWGFIDKTGKIIIKPQYKDATVFVEDLALVKFRNNKVGYIDKEGKTIIEPEFKAGSFFSEGKALVLENRRKNAKYRYINKKGEFIGELKFDDGKEFREGLAPVKIKDAWKYIDETGKIVLDNEGFGYQDAGMFSEGLAPVFGGKGRDMKSYTYYYIDKSGKEIIKLETGKYMAVSPFSEGKAAVMYNRKWGYINKKGEYVIKATFDFAHSFHNGIAAVHADANKWAFIKDDGTYLTNTKWGGAGWAPQFYGNYWEPIRAKLQQASSVGHMLFGGKLPMFNASVIVEINDYRSVPYFSEGYSPMLLHVNKRKREALFGFVDKTGKRLSEKKKYNRVWPFKNGLAKVAYGKGDQNDKYGYIDITGKEVWKPQK